ncbi:Arachidonate 8S-lipoxygenase, partial [Oryzias melastigma]
MTLEYEVTVFTEEPYLSWSLYKSLNITLEGTKGKSEVTSYHKFNLSFFGSNEIKFPVKCSSDLGHLVGIKLEAYWSIPFQSPWYHLKQNPGPDNPVFLPSDSENDWLLAKLFVRSADFNLHELNYHLLRTHLLAEVFAVALKRNLPRVHPVHKILIRHTRYTLQINVKARNDLISQDGVFTEFTASGGAGMLTIMEKSLSNLTYQSLCIPDDIEDRGLNDVKNFYYKEDGLKLWNIMHSFVEDTLSYYYGEDSDVKDDEELQNWIKEISEHGSEIDAGFVQSSEKPRTEEQPSTGSTEIPKSLETREELFKFVTMVMFTCSAQHAAVNSGQYDFYGWMPK